MGGGERLKRAAENQGQDQYVLTVFIPILVIAILACAGGCCYMERRRRRRKLQNGGMDPEELRQQQDFDDTASVISAASSRKRHYLNPTQTTGRLVRGASVRSNYSTFGEPLYEARKREKAREGNSRRGQDNYFDNKGQWNNYENRNRDRLSSRPSSGYGARPLSRSRSMVDVRDSNHQEPGGLRRSRSSNNLNRYRNSTADSGYPENQSNESETENPYEFLNTKPGPEPEDNNSNMRYNRPPSPAQSQWSVRTAPSRTGYEDHNMKGLASRPSSRPSSMVDFPLPEGARERRGLSRMRSMSQPNLQAIAKKTYPQGILKKGFPGEDGRYPGMSNQTSNSSDSGIKDIYGEIPDVSGRTSRLSQRHTLPNMMDDMSHLRPSSRPPSVMSYSSNANRRQQSYDPYFTPRYAGYTNGNMQQSNGYREPPVYSITGNGYHHHQQLPVQDTYGQTNYDPYAGYNGYWNQQGAHQGHRYRASMY